MICGPMIRPLNVTSCLLTQRENMALWVFLREMGKHVICQLGLLRRDILFLACPCGLPGPGFGALWDLQAYCLYTACQFGLLNQGIWLVDI